MRRIPLALAVCLALASGPAGPARAGSVRGGVSVTRTVQGFHAMTFKVHFHAGQPAVVQVQGDGDTNLDLYVYDPQGRLVGRDVGPTDRCRVSWTPHGAGPYTIRVTNLGGVPNSFRLRTN